MLYFSTLLLLFGPPDSAPDTSQLPENRVLWRDAARTLPLFIPASLLTSDGHAKAGSPVNDSELESLRRKVLQVTQTPLEKRACDWAVTGSVPAGANAPTTSLSGPLGRIDEFRSAHPRRAVSLYGEVVKVESGWIPAYEYPGSLVAVRVIEILLDPSARLREGDVIVFLQQVGRLRLGEAELCTQSSPHYSAGVSDSLLLVGSHDPNNDGMVNTGRRFVFKVEDGLLHSPFEPAPFRLEELRRDLTRLLRRP